MKDDMIAYSELCHIWANSFGFDDIINDICKQNKNSIAKVLRSIGLDLDVHTIADIFNLSYDENFLIFSNHGDNYYFPTKSDNDIVTYAEILESEKRFNLINQYVKLYYKDITVSVL